MGTTDRHSPRVIAIILAAGASERMGTPKALLTFQGTTFLGRITQMLRSAAVNDIIVVTGAHGELIGEDLQGEDVVCVHNAGWEQGQLSSIQTGLKEVIARGGDAVMLCPVDHPVVRAETISRMLHLFASGRSGIVVPVHSGRRGHPVILDRALFPELMAASPDVGAREVIRRDPGRVVELVTDDGGILLNIDTPADFEIISNTRPHS